MKLWVKDGSIEMTMVSIAAQFKCSNTLLLNEVIRLSLNFVNQKLPKYPRLSLDQLDQNFLTKYFMVGLISFLLFLSTVITLNSR